MYVCRSGGVDAAIEEAKKDLKQVSQKKSCKIFFIWLFISALVYANEWYVCMCVCMYVYSYGATHCVGVKRTLERFLALGFT